MRNLKKVLSLALCLVMLLGMMVVGAGAVETKFPDNDKIGEEYKEAVLVMNALKIFQGDAQGKVNPKNTLTRAEAAKIMTLVMLGESGAKGFASSRTSEYFQDMKDSSVSWACGYVDYCASMDIIKGTSATTVNPSGKLKGFELAGMLLRAIGVPEAETFVGNGYETRIIAAATKYGLSNANRDEITREAAAKMAFEGILSSPEGAKIAYTTSDNKTFTSAADAYFYQQTQNEGKDPVADADEWVTVEMTTTYPGSLGEKIFGLTKNESATDDFGRPATEYNADKYGLNVKIPNVTTHVYEGPVTNKTVRADVGSAALKYTWTKSVDGVSGSLDAPKNDSNGFDASARGTVTEVYVNAEAKTVKVVIVNTYVGEVLRVTPAKGENDRTVTLVGGKTFATEDFAKDDVVLYTMADGDIVSMKLAGTVTGNLEKKVVNANPKKCTYTVDGTVYKWSEKATAEDIAQSRIGSEITLYVDDQNNIVSVGDAAAQADQYIYILANPSAKENPDYITGVKDVVEVYGVLADGTYGKYTVKSVISTLKINTSTGAIDGTSGTNTDVQCVVDSNPSNAGTKTNSAATAADSTYSKYVGKSDLAGNGYKFTTDSNGYLTLKEELTVNNATAITSNTRKDTNAGVLNSSTVFVFIETAGGDNKTVKNVEVKTGVANIGVGVGAGDGLVALKSGVAKVVFVDSAFDAGTGDTGTLVYVKSVSKIQTSSSTTTYLVEAVDEDGNDLDDVTWTGDEANKPVAGDVWTLDDDGNLKTDKTASVIGPTDIYEVNGDNVRYGAEDGTGTNRLFQHDETKTVDLTGGGLKDLALGQRAILVKESAANKDGYIRVAFILESTDGGTVMPSGNKVQAPPADKNTVAKYTGSGSDTTEIKAIVTVAEKSTFTLPSTAVEAGKATIINGHVIKDWGDPDKAIGFTFPISDYTHKADYWFKLEIKDDAGAVKHTEYVKCSGTKASGMFYLDKTENLSTSVKLAAGETYFWTVSISTASGAANGDGATYETVVARNTFTMPSAS